MNVAGGHVRDFVDYLADGVRYIVVYRSLYEIMNQIGEAFSEMKNVDKELISVRKTTGMAENEIEKIRKASYGVATEYSRTASEYLGSVSEFARGGYKELSTELAKVSLLTQNVGDVNSETADRMLLSIDAAYGLKGSVSELTNVVNGLNNIANLNPTSMQKMADGMQVSASMAKVAGLEISDLVALIGTGTAVTQREGGEIARAIRTIMMNIRQVKGELEDGTVIDDDSIAKAEAALKGVGIATKEVVNGVRELRDPMDILDELAGKWSTLNTEAQSVILEGLANKRQANVLAAILENYEMVGKMQSEYFNSANSAVKENELYLQGWEATQKRVSAKWTEFIAGMADTAVITGSLNALYGVLVALDTPIGRIATSIVLVNTALAVSGRLWQAIRARSIVADILSMGVAERSLGTAIQLVTGHLWQQTAAWAATPFGMATIAIAGISLLISGIRAYNQKLEESRQEMIEAGKEAAKLTKDLDGLVEQYRKLGEDGKLDNSDREQAKNIQEQINQLLGDEAVKVNLINGNYEEQLKLLRKIQYEKANDKYATIADAKEAAEDSLLSKNIIATAGVWETLEETDAIADVMKKHGFEDYMGENGYGEKVLSTFNVDTSSAEPAIKSYEDMIKLRDIIRQSYGKEIEEGGALEDFYDSLNKKIGEMSDAVTKYKDALSDYNINEAVIQFNETEFDGLKGALIDTEEELVSWINAMLTSEDISNSVKGNLIGLANTYFPNMCDGIDETVQAHFKEQAAQINSQNTTDGTINKLFEFGRQCGLTENAIADLIAKEIVFNNTNLDVAGKIAALASLQQQLGLTTSAAIALNSALAGKTLDSRIQMSTALHQYGIKRTASGYSYNGVEYESGQAALNAAMYSDITSSLAGLGGSGGGSGGGITSGKGSGSGGGGGGSSTNKNEALDNYLEYAEDLYKVHQDEAKYINDLQWGLNNIAKTMEEQAEIADEIEQARRDYAENRIKDLEHENELLEQVGGTEEQRIANLEEMQRIREEEANRYRAWMREQLLGMGYTDEDEISRLIENSDFIQEQQSGWWDDQEKILDIRDNLANSQIDDIEHQIDLNINNYGEEFNNNAYYKQIQDIAHAEAERLRTLDPEKYKEQIQEWQNVWWDAEKSILDFNKSVLDDFFSRLNERLDKEYDIRISRLESESSLISTHFDLVNAISEEQHNLNKELLEAETIGARMNEQERETLFTKNEHTRLSGKLNDVMLDITDLQSDYQHDLATATEDTIEEITNNYERQYELKMKEYEIVRAELDLMKKKQVLENIENEKSVRTWSGSGWIYTSVIQDVLDAQEEVANAEYELAKAKTEEAQQNAINALDANADALQTEKNRLATAIDEMAEKMEGSGKEITNMLKTIAETDLPTFDAIIQSLGDTLQNSFGISSETIQSYRQASPMAKTQENSYKWSSISTKEKLGLLTEMKDNSDKWHGVDSVQQGVLANRNQQIGDILGLDYDDSTGRWKKPDGTYAYATGTKNARKGLGLFDEEGLGSEFILTKDGVLTQFQGGEHVFSPEMADRLWEMAQQNYSFAPVISQPDFSKITAIEERINNAVSNAITNNAFGDTYYNTIKDVHVNDSNDAVKGFMNYLKKKI